MLEIGPRPQVTTVRLSYLDIVITDYDQFRSKKNRLESTSSSTSAKIRIRLHVPGSLKGEEVGLIKKASEVNPVGISFDYSSRKTRVAVGSKGDSPT